jgi:hypothetical protein
MKKWLFIGGAVVVLLLLASTQVCLSAVARYGLWLDRCPDGDVRQTVAASGGALMRSVPSSLSIDVTAHYTWGPDDIVATAPVKSFKPTVTLIGAGVKQVLEPKDHHWESSGPGLVGQLELPKVNDGDYVLEVRAVSSLGESKVELPLPLYAPARVHLLTDRPLYEPGNTVKFRALALKASDLSPLDGRPGTFRVTSPLGEVLLEEKAAAGPWGVVSGSFPLDAEAESGDWSVSWTSGSTSETRSFAVRPFTLPRFHIEAHTKKPFYRRNERPQLKGEVQYASGAPVAKAKVELTWSCSGDWPAPASWLDGSTLPKVATTDASGQFSVELPAVPNDLQKQATLVAHLAATDDSGDRVDGAASILLSQDAIHVDAVSELQDGLVEGFNNRLYLRATTADGRVLDSASLHVKRLWEPTDKGVTAPADEDGVASLQLDPGPPVNVVVPPMPFRPPPRAKPVLRQELDEVMTGDGEVSLGDRLAFDRVEAKLGECARYVASTNTVAVSVRVTGSGSIAAKAASPGKLGDCVQRVLGGLSLPAGKDRLLQASFSFDDSDLPKLNATVESTPANLPMVEQTIEDALVDARDCVPPTIAAGQAQLPRMITWAYRPGDKELALSWIANPGGDRAIGESAVRCIEGRLTRLKLPKHKGQSDEDDAEEGGEAPAIGFARLTVNAPAKYEAERPQATTLVGYEFLVTAKLGTETIGTTKLLMTPGTIPPLRVRASAQLVKPGESVDVDVLRGPDYTGDVPELAYFTRPGEKAVELKLDPKTRKTKVAIPSDAEGWASVEVGSAVVHLFIQPKARLAVKVTPDKERYAPGALAHLALETKVGTAGGPAAVGLFGVDNSLSQLVPLPGSDELSGMRPQVSAAAAFSGIDAQALTMGRVRGANAAAATLLKVSALPTPAAVETPVAASGQTLFDPIEGLTDHFYTVLSELHRQTREWEAKAPADEKMTPAKMAELWNKALDVVQSGPDKDAALDAYGRRLRLHRLPNDLLTLTEPRQVVVVGTRLPEDVQNWTAWVAKERP